MNKKSNKSSSYIKLLEHFSKYVIDPILFFHIFSVSLEELF